MGTTNRFRARFLRGTKLGNAGAGIQRPARALVIPFVVFVFPTHLSPATLVKYPVLEEAEGRGTALDIRARDTRVRLSER